MLQAITKMIMMFTHRQKVKHMLAKIDDLFWKVEDVPDAQKRRIYSEQIRSTFKLIAIRGILSLAWYFTVVRINTMPMNLYRPRHVPVHFLIMYENLFCLLLSITSVSTDGIIMTTLIVTLVQFKILNDDLVTIFNSEAEEGGNRINNIDVRIRRWIEHHNFLLE